MQRRLFKSPHWLRQFIILFLILVYQFSNEIDDILLFRFELGDLEPDGR